ncbi:ABC transporter permease [Microbacterium lacticum]|uniref:ABC transporter permease n=2 Tax=Microbacterium lacticum TaxID=33885 RepID=UPI001144F57A|nr:ABC transporter permease [Microbacterium lacticum]
MTARIAADASATCCGSSSTRACARRRPDMTIPAQTPATVDAAGIGTPETATMVTAEPQAPKKRTFFSQLRASLAMFANPKSAAGLIILGIFVLVAIFAPLIAPYDPTAQHLDHTLEPPSWQFPLGATHIGEDVFSQIIYGTRGVLVVGFLATMMATVMAILVGVTAGYLRGWKSESLSALSNVFLVLPALPLMIIIASQFQDPPLVLIAAVLGLTGWAWGARVLRAQTMSLRPRSRHPRSPPPTPCGRASRCATPASVPRTRSYRPTSATR